MDKQILLSKDGYELVRYNGEVRIEHAASGTCSVWLHHSEYQPLIEGTADMADYDTSETLDAQ